MSLAQSIGLRAKRPSFVPAVLALLGVPLLLTACGEDGTQRAAQVQVFAAASLTEAFAELADVFELANPGQEVRLNLAGSSRLSTQILEGGPADVFASADRPNMDLVDQAGSLLGPQVVFATNRLEIAVPPGNPGQVSGLADFANASLLIGLCAEAVPCGALAAQALAASSVEPAVDTYEADVKALLTKITADELDAGLVYATDVLAADGAVAGIEINFDQATSYPVAVLENGSNPTGGRLFVAFLLSEAGQEILKRHGFGGPGL